MAELHQRTGRLYRRSIERLFSIPQVRNALAALGVFVRSYHGGKGFANYVWHDLGYVDAQLTEEFWISVIHPEDRDEAMQQYEELLEGRRSLYRLTYRVRGLSGEYRWIFTSGRVISWDANGSPTLFIGADIDITDRRRAQAEAAQQAQEAETLRMAGAIVASTLEIERTVQLVLDQAYNVVPYDTATVALLDHDGLEIIGGSGWSNIDAVRGICVPYPGENPHSQTIKARSALVFSKLSDEFPSFAQLAGSPVTSWLGVPLIVHGEVMGILVFHSAAEGFFTTKHIRLATALGDHVAVAIQNARLFEQTRELAMTDSLTGIATRRNLYTQAERIVEQARRSGRPVSVIMTDLDHFKQINDEHGHAKGDDAIRLAAEAAQAALRKSDVIGRYGGEEFGIILPETDEGSALAIAERIREGVRGVEVPGTSSTLTISVGVVTVDEVSDQSVDLLLDQADRALFEAKSAGRDRVAAFAKQE